MSSTGEIGIELNAGDPGLEVEGLKTLRGNLGLDLRRRSKFMLSRKPVGLKAMPRGLL